MKFIVLFSSLFIVLACSTPKSNHGDFVNVHKVVVGPGPEDFVLDTAHNRLIISCAERRSDTPNSAIWQMDLTREEAVKMQIVNLPDMGFYPHGVDLLHKNDTLFLFVINHISKKSKTDAVYRFVVEKDRLLFDYNFDSLIGHPNDLYAAAKDEFYYSDDKKFFGSIVHRKGEKEKKVIKSLRYPNGLLIEDSTLYFSTVLFGKCFRANLKEYKKEKMVSVKGADNIMNHSSETFTVASQNIMKFFGHVRKSENRSPSTIYSVNKRNNQKELLFFDNGENISAASTGLLYRNKLYIGQVFDNFILICDRPE